MNKQELRKYVDAAISAHKSNNQKQFWEIMYKQLLNQKMPFPYSEFIGEKFYESLSKKELLIILDRLVAEEHLGGYVAAGKALQQFLKSEFDFAFEKAVEYMIQGNTWYVTDIIGERVLGGGLLINFNNAYKILESYQQHENFWIKRSVGVAVHLAGKRQIGEEKAKRLMELCLKQAKEKHIHIRKGCGWGIETIGKYYPHVLKQFEERILNDPDVAAWNKKKYHMGLEKAKKIAEKHA